MPEQFISYWDDTLKKYVEVSTVNPLPTNDTAGGGGTPTTSITGDGGDVTTQLGNNDGRAASDIGLVTNARGFGFNGTSWDRLHATTGSLHVAQTGALPAGTNNIGDVDIATIPTVGTHANAWNAATVAVNGVSASIDCQYVSSITVFGNASAAGTITLQYSQDNTNFYDDDLNTVNTGGNNFAINAVVGARYIRLKSDTAATITATIAGKA